jgi:aminoglycoside phosphotransferase
VVTELGPGERADRPDRHPEPGSLPRAVGLGLAALHALPPDLLGRPVDAGVDGWAPIIERCRAAVESGAVDPAALRPPYDRYGPERLLELLVAADGAPGAADRPDRPDAAPVLCHGSPTLDRILVDGDRFAGFDGFETSLVADRHLDLAIAHLAVAEQLGAEAVIGLYEGYGAEPHLLRLDRAVLAAQLLGLGAGSAPGAGSGRR